MPVEKDAGFGKGLKEVHLSKTTGKSYFIASHLSNQYVQHNTTTFINPRFTPCFLVVKHWDSSKRAGVPPAASHIPGENPERPCGLEKGKRAAYSYPKSVSSHDDQPQRINPASF